MSAVGVRLRCNGADSSTEPRNVPNRNVPKKGRLARSRHDRSSTARGRAHSSLHSAARSRRR
eukprot:1580612-Prymnesium_polylepis.1